MIYVHRNLLHHVFSSVFADKGTQNTTHSPEMPQILLYAAEPEFAHANMDEKAFIHPHNSFYAFSNGGLGLQSITFFFDM